MDIYKMKIKAETEGVSGREEVSRKEERGERGGKSSRLDEEYMSRQGGYRQGRARQRCRHGGECKAPDSSRRLTRRKAL